MGNKHDIEHFATYGYLHVSNIVPKSIIDSLYRIYNESETELDEKDLPFTVGKNWRLKDWYTTQETDEVKSIATAIQDIIEEHTGLELIPTYNMGRINTRGQKMMEHTDRAPCEISVTMPIAYSNWPWPIAATTDKGQKEFALEVGDVLIYKGCEVPHKRDENRFSDIVIQHYWHYIDKNSEVGAFVREFMDEPGWIGQQFMGSYKRLVENNHLPLPGEDIYSKTKEKMRDK